MLENQQKKKVEIAKIRVKLNVLKDDLEIAVRERDFMVFPLLFKFNDMNEF